MTYTHIDIDDELLGQAAHALGTKQKKDTVEAALRAAIAKTDRDAAWARFREFAAAGGFTPDSAGVRERLERELAKVAQLESDLSEPDASTR